MDIWLLLLLDLVDDVLTVEQHSVNQSSNNGGERQTVRDSKGGRDEQWRVVLVLLFVEGQSLLVNNSRNVVTLLVSVVRTRVREWQVLGVPSVGVVDGRNNDPENNHDRGEDGKNGRCWWNQWRTNVTSNLVPVKGDWEQTHT